MFGDTEEDVELTSNSSVREIDLVKQKSAVRWLAHPLPPPARPPIR